MIQDHSPAVIAAAKALAEKHYSLATGYDHIAALCEALSTTLSEEAMSECPVCGNEERHSGTGLLTCECPAKPEPTEDYRRRAKELVRAEHDRTRGFVYLVSNHPAYSTVARLLAERDAMQARVGDPVAWLYDFGGPIAPYATTVRNQNLIRNGGTETPLYGGKPAEPTPDPDLVLAREAAESMGLVDTATKMIAENVALRALKLKGQAHDQ